MFFFEIGRYGYKISVFYAGLKMGQTIFATNSYQKLEPKYGFQKKVDFLGSNY
jgi:hypothetical protein